MRRHVTVVLGAAIVVVASLSWYVLGRSAELPDPHTPAHKEVFPDLDFRAAVPGSLISRVYASFGKPSSESSGSVMNRRCIRFKYDAELFDGALVVLARDALVENRWVMKGTAMPAECSGLREEQLDLTGWYAAAVW